MKLYTEVIFVLIYNFLSKPIGLKNLKILIIFYWLRASSSDAGLLRRWRDSENLRQLIVICSIVKGHLHKSHVGLGSLVISKIILGKCVVKSQTPVWHFTALKIKILSKILGKFHVEKIE